MSDFWIDYLNKDGKHMLESVSSFVRTPEAMQSFREQLIRQHKEEGHTILMINCVKYVDTTEEL